MYPILARYGSIFIYSFTVVLALGVVLATLLTARMAKTKPAEAWFDVLLFVFIAALGGSRCGFIIDQWAYFQQHVSEIWQFWQGGLSYYGALLAGLAALRLWTGFHGRSYYLYAALFSPGWTLVVVFGWLACWFEGCAYGLETSLRPLAADLPDEFGILTLRYQTQLIGLLLSLAAFLAILWLFKRVKSATLFWTTLLLISITHLIPGFLRGDPTLILRSIRLDILLDASLIAISVLMLQYSVRHKQCT